MTRDKMFKFEPSLKKQSCYTVFKFFGNRNGINRFLPVAEIEMIGNKPNITFLTQANLTEDDRNFILEKATLL